MLHFKRSLVHFRLRGDFRYIPVYISIVYFQRKEPHVRPSFQT